MADIHGAPSESMMTPVQSADIAAPMDEGAMASAFDASVGATGAGVLYPQSPRQAETERLLTSPPGFADFTITGGFNAGGEWPGDVSPPGGDPHNGGYGGA